MSQGSALGGSPVCRLEIARDVEVVERASPTRRGPLRLLLRLRDGLMDDVVLIGPEQSALRE